MINVQTKLTGDLSADLDRFELIVKGKVLISGAAGMAEVIYKRARENAPVSEHAHFFYGTHQKYGPYTPGSLQRAIYRAFAKERSTDERAVYVVRWRTQKPPVGVPYGFMVEYGTSKAPANSFLRRAFDTVPEAIEAGKERMRARMNSR